uniref:EOG090X0COM n=1 Tax=Simocephalus serrulatus TaxID=117539 RepID=A0A4Y7NMJ2_9CRUS|nr:EOG090X0COM [Simocephalus serrulatus]SVE94478.1 EOG090X0COM [Simocephalus serrulatus]
MMQNVLNGLARLCVSSSRNVLIQNVPEKSLSTFVNIGHYHQQYRFINKHAYQTEPGWKAFGNKWMVKFPEQYTIKKLRLEKLAGRDPLTGKRVVGGLGGGHKKKYRWVDNCRHGPKEGPPLVEKILQIQYDPCRSARIALIAGGDKARYIIATTSMKVGDLISTSGHIPRIAIRPKEGDAHPLGALPVGTEICCVEKYVGEGSSIAVVAGSRAFLVRKVGDRCIVQMPSKQELSLKQECMATVGRVSNEEHSSHHIGSAQRLRWLGFRPRSGLWHRKDGRHGRKIRPLPPLKVIDTRKVEVESAASLTVGAIC